MDSENNVYDYVVENINNILTHGIEYYTNRNDILKNKLLNFYEYINDEDMEIVIDKETPIEVDNVSIPQTSNEVKPSLDNPAKEKLNIKELTEEFINKMINIKLSLLKIDSDDSIEDPSFTNNIVANEDNQIDTNATETAVFSSFVQNLDLDENIHNKVKPVSSNILDKEENDQGDLLEKTTFDLHLPIEEEQEDLDSKIDEVKKSDEHHSSILDIFRKKD